ncbi:hypothetical protein CSV75_02805 [Sporosarcina sp. P18a]|uniref:hypothetical protein n=1 Tax=Sporosarcina sp. P18a TaxID=2048259 RepID=UPI000C168838|nr:hypothetical protein [Sporosarcina sp. P18a]PIC80735.1 hypothetical protein CSV75_02805 [Sporosarcina sp. P18a]
MITVEELFDYAVDTDMSLTAHSIFWAITNHKVRMDEDCEKLKEIEFDQEAIQQPMKKNTLRIGEIKLFVVKSTQPNWYAFYLGKKEADAYRLHSETFRETGVKVTHADRLMPNLLTFAESGREESLYEYRKRVMQFPVYVGHVEAGKRLVHRVLEARER